MSPCVISSPALKSSREMGKKEEIITTTGEVMETLPNTMFRVKLDDGTEERMIIAIIAGRMRKHYVKILPGDRVKLEISPYDLERGRIVYRFK